MPNISVPLGERSYNISIKSGALQTLAHDVALPLEIAVLSNQTVAPIYADALAEKLRKNGKRVLQWNAPDGEKSKSSECLLQAWDALAEFNLSRRGAVIAVGGGVVGDLAGFVAATWMRGVEFIQIPTTLLAMVDSSVGGKTGINHPRAKNLIGAFWQPSRVVIDPQCLQTLPKRELCAGLAEVIKYGVIEDAEFFDWLEKNIEGALQLDPNILEHIIARSCEIKAQIVGQDERESDALGRRAILNYGHTIGHAIEATTSYGEFLHGEALAIGMNIEARLSLELGLIDEVSGRALIARQSQLLQRSDLPTSPPKIEFEKLWAAMTLDKKARSGGVNFVLPTKIGRVETVQNVAVDAVRAAIESL